MIPHDLQRLISLSRRAGIVTLTQFEVLAQLVDRGTIQIQLPSKPTKSDVVEFLRHYGLKFPTESDAAAARLLNDTIAGHGLRMLTLRLRDGKAFAVKRGEEYTWDHFVNAFEAIQSLSK